MNSTTQLKAAALALLLLLPGTAVLAAKAMPTFSLSSAADNSLVHSDAFKDKVLLVSFFATWCPPCRQEIPAFIELQKELGDRGFSVLGISIDTTDGTKAVQTLIEQEKVNYPILMADSTVINGFGGIEGVPTSFLINSSGNVVKRYVNYIPYELLKKDIEMVLNKK